MLKVSWWRRCPSNILSQMLSFLWPLTPPIPILEGSCNKNQETIGDHLVSFPANSQTRESHYSTFDRKLLAAHFRHFCEGQAFQLWTDDKPLVTAISRVSTRKQHHLAFISEFNVQLLYLPGLKNVVADFLSCPNQTATGSAATMSAADPVAFEEMAAEQNRCPETQRLPGGISLKLSFRHRRSTPGWRCFQRQFSPNCPPQNSGKAFLIIFIILLTPGGSPPVVLFHLGLCGTVFPATSPAGPTGVWPASEERSTATHAWSPNPSPSPNGFFLTCKLIWLALFSTVIILIIFLLLLIVRPNGWKPSPFKKRPQQHAQSFNFYLDFSFWSTRNDHF